MSQDTGLKKHTKNIYFLSKFISSHMWYRHQNKQILVFDLKDYQNFTLLVCCLIICTTFEALLHCASHLGISTPIHIQGAFCLAPHRCQITGRLHYKRDTALLLS